MIERALKQALYPFVIYSLHVCIKIRTFLEKIRVDSSTTIIVVRVFVNDFRKLEFFDLPTSSDDFIPIVLDRYSPDRLLNPNWRLLQLNSVV